MNILSDLSKGNAHVEAIREQLFNVITLPLYPPALQGIQAEHDVTDKATFDRPLSFGNWKHTGGECLGVLGKDWLPTQPVMLLDAFETCLIDSGIDLSTLNYQELKGGKKVRFSVNLGETKFKNQAKQGDVLSRRLVLQTGFDGYTATSFMIETEVLKCTNGMTGFGTEATVKFKNTKNNVGKIAIACTDIAQMITKADEFGELMKQYDKTAITTKDVDAFLTATLGYNRKQRAELGKVKNQRLDDIQTALDIELKRNGKTAWGLLNSMTYATNHIWTSEEAKLDYLTTGAGLRTNNKAQKFLNELVGA